MPSVILWTIAFSISTAISIVLLGDRKLISGNLFSMKAILAILLNWKFIVSMLFAVVARMSFIMTNNSLLKIPDLAKNSTTITTFITTVTFVVVIFANYFFLGERLMFKQAIGCLIILAGVWMILGS